MRHINRTACRILVVDDEEANLDLIQQILLREGYTDVTVLADPHSVLGCFLDRRPDLILLDLHMPGLDGFAILDLLAPHIAPEAYLPILVLTADATREARQRALAAGAKDFVTKPFDRVELALRIRNLLDTRVLHLQLQERTQTLERLYQDAQAALGARDELLSVITHDLGQPLTAISLSARHIRYTVENGAADPPAYAEDLAGIDEAVAKMTAMLGELMDLARLEQGRTLELNWRPMDLVALTRREAAAHQKLTARHIFVVESSVASLLGEWDPIRLMRVLANLLTNAIKYSPQGGTIHLRLGREQDAHGRSWARLSVTDEGIGIPAADLPHVFERFYRAENAATVSAGAGIGLAGAAQIVEQHGGTISVESALGAGTTFIVRLPID